MTRIFCNIPALEATLSYWCPESELMHRIVAEVRDEVSGVRLPPYEIAEQPAFQVLAHIELDAALSGNHLMVQFGAAIESHPYRVALGAFHWDFWKISISALIPALLARGIVVFHAACIMTAGKVYLLPGMSGAGKSTLSFYARSQGARVFASELAFVNASGMLAGNALMSIDDAAMRLMHIPKPERARCVGGRVLAQSDPLPAPLAVDSVIFPRISPTKSYSERLISARRSRMLLFENACGQLGFAQLIDEQSAPVRLLPTGLEIDAIMGAVNRLACRESLICEGSPDRVWAELSGR